MHILVSVMLLYSTLPYSTMLYSALTRGMLLITICGSAVSVRPLSTRGGAASTSLPEPVVASAVVREGDSDIALVEQDNS